MRRASSKLIPFTKPSLPLLSRNLSTQNPITHNFLSNPNFKNLKKLHDFLSSRSNFYASPSQDFTTYADAKLQIPQISSRQRKIKEKSQLEEAFEAAETADEMVKAFKEMEASFEEKELGLACLKMGLKFDQEGEDFEKTLFYGLRALKILDNNDSLSFPLAMTLQLLGSACYNLKRFNDGLGYLNRANRALSKLQEEGVISVNDISPVLHAVQLELANTKTALGRREEALVHLRTCLEIKELTLEEDSKELGNANRDLAEAYVAVLNFNEALAHCLKAIEIHKAKYGLNSVEVAHDRRLLGVIYTGLGHHEKALEQNQLSQKVLKNWGHKSELLRGEIDAANMKISLGKFDEAINTLRSAVQQTEKDSEERAMVFVSMAKGFCNQENFADSKRCLQIACGILDKKETISPEVVSEAFMEISMLYETMNEFETAISLLKRSQAMLEKLPHEQHSVGSVSARIGWLLLLTGKVKQAVPYLEEATERLKESFGSKHYGVGYVYNNLGAAYLELDRPQRAAQVFAYAKDIMDVSLGPHHTDSIESCQNLSKAYDAMGSYELAINFQEKVVEAWEGHGQSAEDELEEARRLLEQLKQKAHGTLSKEGPQKALPLPHTKESVSARRSQSGFADTEKLSKAA